MAKTVVPIVLTPSRARAVILHAAGLHKRAPFGRGPEAVYQFIHHLGFLQIDSNAVVERAHHHAIYARVPQYKREWLEQLQSQGRLYEFWTYAAGFMPMEEFRFSLPVKAAFLSKRPPLTPAEVNLMRKVLDRIAREGPLMSRDFENDRVTKNKGWWDWRPSKLALERLTLEGKLMIVRRKDFQKIYDLPINLLPSGIDMTMPTPEEFARHIIRRSLQAHGIAYAKEIVWSARYVPHQIKTELPKMVATGEICQVQVEGLKGSPLYMLPKYQKLKVKLANECFILSPFDTINVFRHRLRDFFHFDYQVECFVVKPKRKYGYFSLPILLGDTFIARMDSKADRKQRVYTIFNLHFEDLKITKQMTDQLADAIQEFAQFNECDRISIEKCNQLSALKHLRKLLG